MDLHLRQLSTFSVGLQPLLEPPKDYPSYEVSSPEPSPSSSSSLPQLSSFPAFPSNPLIAKYGYHLAPFLSLRHVGADDSIDILSKAEHIKTIFKLPYIQGPVALSVRRAGNTLLLDDAPEEYDFTFNNDSTAPDEDNDEFAPKATSSGTEPVRDLRRVYRRIGSAGAQLVRMKRNVSRAHEEQLYAKFLFYALQAAKGQSSGQSIHEAFQSYDGFRSLFSWKFNNLDMVLGSDMLVFSADGRNSVSIRLRDVEQEIQTQTLVDFWIENVMAQASEMALVYHAEGCITSCQLIKTDEIPRMRKQATFTPESITNHASAILSWIRQQHIEEGRTYLLLKEEGSSLLGLYLIEDDSQEVMYSRSLSTVYLRLVRRVWEEMCETVRREMSNNSSAVLVEQLCRARAPAIMRLLSCAMELCDTARHPDLFAEIHELSASISSTIALWVRGREVRSNMGASAGEASLEVGTWAIVNPQDTVMDALVRHIQTVPQLSSHVTADQASGNIEVLVHLRDAILALHQHGKSSADKRYAQHLLLSLAREAAVFVEMNLSSRQGDTSDAAKKHVAHVLYTALQLYGSQITRTPLSGSAVPAEHSSNKSLIVLSESYQDELKAMLQIFWLLLWLGDYVVQSLSSIGCEHRLTVFQEGILAPILPMLNFSPSVSTMLSAVVEILKPLSLPGTSVLDVGFHLYSFAMRMLDKPSPLAATANAELRVAIQRRMAALRNEFGHLHLNNGRFTKATLEFQGARSEFEEVNDYLNSALMSLNCAHTWRMSARSRASTSPSISAEEEADFHRTFEAFKEAQKALDRYHSDSSRSAHSAQYMQHLKKLNHDGGSAYLEYAVRLKQSLPDLIELRADACRKIAEVFFRSEKLFVAGRFTYEQHVVYGHLGDIYRLATDEKLSLLYLRKALIFLAAHCSSAKPVARMHLLFYVQCLTWLVQLLAGAKTSLLVANLQELVKIPSSEAVADDIDWNPFFSALYKTLMTDVSLRTAVKDGYRQFLRVLDSKRSISSADASLLFHGVSILFEERK